MKNRHVENQENKILQCHALEQGNLMIIMNSKAQGDPILAEHIATMQNSSKSAFLALAETNTDKISAQICVTGSKHLLFHELSERNNY
jgi:hypothetical protein